MSELSDNVQQQLYEHILREKIDDLEAREEQYEARIAELEHDLSNKEIEYTDLWDDMLEMQSRIAELEAERRWIPVSERLPEVNEDVFTVVYDTNDGSTSVCALNHHGDGVWFIWDKGYYVVTHWMPMPKLPEPEEVK